MTALATVDAYRTFLKRMPVTLLAALVLWLVLRPGLHVAVPRLSEVLIRAFEYPRVTRLVTTGHVVEVRRTDFRSDSATPTVGLTEIHFNTIILLALYLAIPRPFSRTQLERLFMGWCVLFLIQSLNLVFHVKCIYALGLGQWSVQHYSDLARNLFGFLRYFTDLPGRFSSPFLIWLGFNWDQVAVLIGTRPVESLSRKEKPRRSK
jgi:hypothetical protein